MLAYFVVTFESFDTDEFVDALKRFNPSGVIVTWNYSGQIRVIHDAAGLQTREYFFYKQNTWRENRMIKWISFFAVMTWIMHRVFSRQRVDRFFLGGGDVLLWIAQLYKVCGRVNKIITTCEDWSMPKRATDIFDWLNRKKFLINDYLMAKFGITVIVYTKKIYDMRNDYWENLTKPGSVLREHKWAALLSAKRERPSARPGSYICLLGTTRRQFGLETLFDLMPELNQEAGIRLKVIGIESPLYREFKANCDRSGVSSYIDWMGFVDNAHLKNAVADCFCGYDMQENPENNSAWIVPGRIVNYIQNFLIPVVSPYSGVIVEFLKERQMGVVCRPNREEIKRAILTAFQDYEKYAGNIDQFIEQNPYRLSVKDLLALSQTPSASDPTS